MDPSSQTPFQQPSPQPVYTPAPQKVPATLSILAIVFGGLGFLLGLVSIAGLVLGLAGLILGIVALKKHSANKALAVVGLVLGSVAVLFSPLSIVTLISYNGITNRAEQAEQRQIEAQQLKQQELFEEQN